MRKIGKYVLVSSLLLNQITPLAMAAEEVSQSIVEGQNLNEEFKGLELIEMSEKLDEVTNQTSGAEETEFSTTIMEESETKIDVSTLKVSSSFATLGDIITISVAIRDEVNHASIQLFNSGSQGLYSQSVGLSYNAETGLYEAQLEITNQIASGNWSINYIEYYDGSGTYYSLHDVNSGMGTTANLSAIKFTVDGTTLDYNIPAIDLESLSVSQSEAVGGDSVIYSLAVSDDTGVSEVWMEFYNLEANQSKTLYFEYNEVSQRFEGDFQIEQYNISNGLWQVKNITTSNFVNNSLTIYNSDFSDYEDAIDLSSLNLTVSENEVDNEEPVINLDSLTISATEAKGGDAITYSVEVTDNAGVSGTYIYLYNPETRKSEYLYLNLNEETNRYEGIFYINTYGTESGVWKISQISAYDIGSNSVTHYNSDIEEHSWSEKKSDLTAYNLTVSGTEVDHETPKLNVESLNVSKKVATLGDSITYSVEVTDNNGNPDVNLRLYNIETEENSYLNLQFNEETNRFEGMFNIDDNTVSGTWIIESIYASDNSNNRVDVYNNNIEQNSSYENAMDLSAFDVLVSGTNPDRSAPVIDIANLQVNLKEAKFGDLIEYTVPATDDTEVSSGNIYFTNRGEASEKSESAYFYYDEKNDVYKAYVKVGKNLTKGDLLIESLSFYDVHGNVAIVYNKQLNPSDEDAVDLSNLNVYIDGYDPSQVPSTEELAGFTISKEFIENGVEVTYNIPSLGEKKYDHGYVHLVNNYYYHQDMSRTIKLTKSSVGELEGKTEFYNRSVYSRVAFLELWDEDGNYITYKNEDFYPNDLDAVNLDWLDTQVTQKDTTAPTINLNSLTVNKTEATVDDKVIFSIKVADESKIRNGFVTLSSEKYSKEEYLNFVFDKATDSYSAELNITEDFADGSWVISRIEFSDYAENISEIYNQKLYPDDMNSIDLSQFDVTVSGTDYDGEAPEIDLTSLSVNKKNVVAGEEIIYSVKATDNNEILLGFISYDYNVLGIGTSTLFEYNDEKDIYEARIPINEDSINGIYEVWSIIFYDSAGNMTIITEDPTNPVSTDLSNLNVEVTGTKPDLVPPVIDTANIKVSQNTGIVGDIIYYQIPVTDDRGIGGGVLTLQSPVKNKLFEIDLTFNEKTQTLEGSLLVDSGKEMGQWKIHSIRVQDTGGMETEIFNSDVDWGWQYHDIVDLRDKNVLVSGTTPDYTNPVIDAESLIVEKTEVELGEEIFISIKASKNQEVLEGNANFISINTKSLKTLSMDVPLIFNSETNAYEGTLSFTDALSYGDWVLENISFKDLNENKSTLYNAPSWYISDTENNQYKDLSRFNISVKGKFPTLTVKDMETEVNQSINYLTTTTAIDLVDGDITNNIKVDDSKVDLTKSGEYQVVYTVTNSRGLTTSKTVVVKVIAPVALKPSVFYSTHIQEIGWQEVKNDGETSGTSGQAKRLEGIQIDIRDLPYEGNIEYQTHVQSYGWMDWKTNGDRSGTEGEAKRLEAIRIKLSGEIADHYDIYYRVHAENYGWLDWAKNGADAGTAGLEKRLEAIQIQLVEKGEPAPGETDNTFVISNPVVSYSTHVQSEGWQEFVSNRALSGTSGRGLRLEGIKISASDPAYSGGIQYRTHIESIGWQDWKSDKELSGTEGRSLRLEAIQIKLDGQMATQYDVYYRVHAQNFGWLDWAKNGDSAGTQGLGFRLEGIEVVLVKKGGIAPGSTQRSFVLSSPSVNYTTHVQSEGWQPAVSDGKMSGTSGRALRLEGILMNVHTQSLFGGIQYRTHVQSEGWQDWKENWQLSGTQGKALRLEAIEIKLTEEMAELYDIYYRVHAESYGWLDWAKNGEPAGTEGLAKRLEGIEVKLVRRGLNAPGSTVRAFVK